MQQMYTFLFVYLHIFLKWGFQVMAKTVRLSDEEQELIRKKAVILNKRLMDKNKQPLRDSELVHAVIQLALDKIEVSASGELILDN